MSFLPLRPVTVSEAATSGYDEWLSWLSETLDDPGCDRNELCRKILTDIYFPQLADIDPTALTPTQRVALLQMDPRNVTLEPEYYQDIDPERYAPRKPLLWLWEMFDRSALGENVALGIPFRRILAKHVFASCGKNFKAFTHVRFSYGYNLNVGDNVVIHRHVLLDDRGGIDIGDGSSVSDFANVYSHSHNIVDGRIVYLPRTIIGKGARITYHATILAGAHVADDSMVGAGSMLTKSTEPHWVYVGVPARKIKEKSPEERARKEPRTPDPMADEG
jgi:acetyltransferase-like isoleucine patch superfamily enzyme